MPSSKASGWQAKAPWTIKGTRCRVALTDGGLYSRWVI